MKTSSTHAFVNQFVIGLIVAIGFGGSVGLGTVWLRHQISVVADTNAQLQRQISDVERRIADTSALVEESMSPDVLRARNESMKLGFVELTQIPIETVAVDPIPGLVARANRRVFQREGAVGIQLDLRPASVTSASLFPASASAAGRSVHAPAIGFHADSAPTRQIASSP
jgi:hypothetical protein